MGVVARGAAAGPYLALESRQADIPALLVDIKYGHSKVWTESPVNHALIVIPSSAIIVASFLPPVRNANVSVDVMAS